MWHNDMQPTSSLTRSPTWQRQQHHQRPQQRRSVLDTPLPVPLLDRPANLERLLARRPERLRARVEAVAALLGFEGARRVLHARPAEVLFAPDAVLSRRVALARDALGCGAAEALDVAVSLRWCGAARFEATVRAARALADAARLPPLAAVGVFLSHGAGARAAAPPAEIAADAAARLAALRAELPAAAPGDLLALVRLARARPGPPEALVASLAAAAGALGLTPYRVLQLLLNSGGKGDVGGGSSSSSASGSAEAAPADATIASAAAAAPALAGPEGKAGAARPYGFLLAPAPQIRARAAAAADALGLAPGDGARLASLLRSTPGLLALDAAALRGKVGYLAAFLTGVGGGGGGSSSGSTGGSGSAAIGAGGSEVLESGAGGDAADGSSSAAATGVGKQETDAAAAAAALQERLREETWPAARAALRACPRVLLLSPATCVERVRAAAAALGLPDAGGCRIALSAPGIMTHPRERIEAAAARLAEAAGGLEAARAIVARQPRALESMCLMVARGGGSGGGGGEDASTSKSTGTRRRRKAPSGSGTGGDPVASRLRWLAGLLGATEAEAFAAAVRCHYGRHVLWQTSEVRARASLARLAALLRVGEPEAARLALAGRVPARAATQAAEAMVERAAALAAALDLGDGAAGGGGDGNADSSGAGSERLAALLRRAPGLLMLSPAALEARLEGLAAVAALLASSGGGGQGGRAAAAAGTAAADAAARRLALARPELLLLDGDRVARRVRRLAAAAAALPDWARQVAAGAREAPHQLGSSLLVGERRQGYGGGYWLFMPLATLPLLSSPLASSSSSSHRLCQNTTTSPTTADSRFARLDFLLASGLARAGAGGRGGACASVWEALRLPPARFAARWPSFADWRPGPTSSASAAPAKQLQQPRAGAATARAPEAQRARRAAVLEAVRAAGAAGVGTGDLIALLTREGATTRAAAASLLRRMEAAGALVAAAPPGSARAGGKVWLLPPEAGDGVGVGVGGGGGGSG